MPPPRFGSIQTTPSRNQSESSTAETQPSLELRPPVDPFSSGRMDFQDTSSASSSQAIFGSVPTQQGFLTSTPTQLNAAKGGFLSTPSGMPSLNASTGFPTDTPTEGRGFLSSTPTHRASALQEQLPSMPGTPSASRGFLSSTPGVPIAPVYGPSFQRPVNSSPMQNTYRGSPALHSPSSRVLGASPREALFSNSKSKRSVAPFNAHQGSENIDPNIMSVDTPQKDTSVATPQWASGSMEMAKLETEVERLRSELDASHNKNRELEQRCSELSQRSSRSAGPSMDYSRALGGREQNGFVSSSSCGVDSHSWVLLCNQLPLCGIGGKCPSRTCRM